MKQKIQIIVNVDIPKNDCYGCDLCYDCLYCMANSEIKASTPIPDKCPIHNGYILKDVKERG